mgnify:FL=1
MPSLFTTTYTTWRGWWLEMSKWHGTWYSPILTVQSHDTNKSVKKRWKRAKFIIAIYFHHRLSERNFSPYTLCPLERQNECKEISKKRIYMYINDNANRNNGRRKEFPGKKKNPPTSSLVESFLLLLPLSHRLLTFSRSHRRCSILNVIYEKIFIHLIWREMLPLQCALLTHQVLFYFLFFGCVFRYHI